MKTIGQVPREVQVRLFGPGRFTDYLIISLWAALPVILAQIIGIAKNRTATIGASQATCWGYWERRNWLSLIILLPISLFTARAAVDLLFRLSPRFARYKHIPDLIPGDSESAKLEFLDAFADGRNLIAAFLITVGLQLVDMWDTLLPYAHGFRHSSPTLSVPGRWDWALWFLSNPSNRGLYWKDMALVAVAYSNQFLMTLIAVGLIVAILRHNLFYLRSIYLRSRAQKFPNRPMVALDFGADDLCFGLTGLYHVFNVQILMLAAAGAYVLISRSSNSDTQAMTACFLNFSKGKFDVSECWGAVFGNLPQLFPTIGQKIFPFVWLAMFLIVLLPAFVKLLPFSTLFRAGPVNARQYLLQFLRPDSETAVRTNDLLAKDAVDAEATRFASQSFWPVSQASAEFFSIAAFFVFFLIVTPVFAWPLTIGQILFYGFLIVMAFTCSAALFSAFRYALRSVDQRLVQKPARTEP